jgi:pimeloyl-ACP methyl ester carboxylesterase
VAEPVARVVKVDGIDVAVETLGEGTESVLFVHGLGSNRGCWYRAQEFFDLQRFRLILPDLPGFGESARPAEYDYSMAAFGDCLHRVIMDNRVERLHVVAHSMGCAAALCMIETHAICPDSFVAAEGNLVAEDTFMSGRIARFAELDFLRSFATWLAVIKEYIGDEPNEQQIRFVESLRNASPLAVHRASISCNERSRSGALSSRFAALGCPTAYVYGANTLKQRPIPQVALLPHVHRVSIANQGHFMMQAAEGFYPQLAAFIASVSGACATR